MEKLYSYGGTPKTGGEQPPCPLVPTPMLHVHIRAAVGVIYNFTGCPWPCLIPLLLASPHVMIRNNQRTYILSVYCKVILHYIT